MISVQSAQQRILSHFQPLETSLVPLDGALGRILTQPVISGIHFPLFDNSSVDGFAVRMEDVRTATSAHPVTLDVVADIPAGQMPEKVISTGQAARIMTGAPVPGGADAVIMVEDTDCHDRKIDSHLPEKVHIYRPANSGENIRRSGTDIQPGQAILPNGTLLRPQDIGILALLGIASVPVRRKPRVAIISSGDELVSAGMPLLPGKIYDSNGPMLAALIQKAECEVISLGVVPDRQEAVQEIFARAAQTRPDVIISSAGVGAGAFDYIKSVVESSGSLNFWKVNMRPGKPLAFGIYRDIPFFGLPGNPVSSYVSFLVFVQPALERMSGIALKTKISIRASLVEPIESDGRESYLRAIVQLRNGKYQAMLTGHQGSGNLFSTVQANALLVIPAGVTTCPAGAEFEAWLFEP